MPRQTQLAFLSLRLAQAAHFREECVTRLYAVSGAISGAPPAR
jgi:hypothetical protein